MNIYFAGSIRGGRDDQELYEALIENLSRYGTVLTEHIGDAGLEIEGEKEMSDFHIHERDINWLLDADVMIAEVSTPSLGVGYEIGQAVAKKIPVLCLYRPKSGRKLSAMIAGSPNLSLVEYDEIKEAKKYIQSFFSLTHNKSTH